MAEITRCRHNETGGEAELPTDALAAWRAHGWEPISESRSLAEAEAERVQAENAAAAEGEAVVEPEPEPIPESSEVAPVTPANQSTTTAGDAGTEKEN